ncbi:MAG: N-acetylmuramoyl-L-alanine amidase [Bacteroidales bacterium]|nr:N-acetylmuramoyl-L-alanine amidase [Bacteroidales bacterium]MCM1416187.1 N-acetylmuramoyl-L-alanine amidase [bacterium]MCM1424212.1 N-acetylmuramoyl-L-alanine amidase [bacterium]
MERVKSEKYDRCVRILLLLLMIAAAGFILRGGVRLVSSGRIVSQKEKARPCVVIDAGHGGADPGKVGVDGSLEKDINLQIAKKLAQFLAAADVDVTLTRETDAGLYDENVSNKKVQDMKNRVALIEERKPALTVSIHQNSYHEEYVHGAQVFYYKGSEESKALAERIQQTLSKEVDPDNARQAKANDSYYLLKKTSSPIVIVECGFLSNWEEAQKLSQAHYQERTAWAIHLAVLAYLNAAK